VDSRIWPAVIEALTHRRRPAIAQVTSLPEMDPSEYHASPDDDYNIDRDDVASILAVAAEEGDHALLFGPYGTGKTTEGKRSAADGQRVIEITCRAEQTAASIWGHMVNVDGNTTFHPGPGMIAWEQGALLIINEIDKANDDVSDLLHVLMDDPEVAQHTLPSGVMISPKSGFRVVATTNGLPEDLAGAVLDRFTVCVDVNRPSVEMLRDLPDDVRWATEALYEPDDYAPPHEDDLSYRTMKGFAAMREQFGESRAARLVCGDVDQARALLQLVNDVRRTEMSRLSDDEFNIPRDDVDEIVRGTAGSDGGHALLYGSFGTGKTTVAHHAAQRKQKVYEFTCREGVSAASIWGHMVNVEGNTVFRPGPGLLAWREGALLVVNEIDKANEDVLDLLHLLMDDPEVASNTLMDGTTVRPRRGFRVVATTNGTPLDCPGAVRDRFSVMLEVAEPSSSALAQLPDDVRAATRALYASARHNPLRQSDITYRTMRAFAKWRPRVGEARAATLATGNAEQAVALVEAVQMQRVRHEASASTLG
jgi:MoxR-like ATPase